MTRRDRKRWCALIAALAALSGCAAPARDADRDRGSARQERLEVAAALQHYQAAARTVHLDSVAVHFTPTATLFEPGIMPVSIRDSIRTFVASFPGVRVDSASATPDTIEVFGGTAFVWGSYYERLAFPGQPVSEQHGRFVAEWRRQADGTWLIQRLFRVPLPAPPAGGAGPARPRVR